VVTAAAQVINRGGETLSPFEIEDAMRSHPSLREVMAFSAPHSLFQVRNACLRSTSFLPAPFAVSDGERNSISGGAARLRCYPIEHECRRGRTRCARWPFE